VRVWRTLPEERSLLFAPIGLRLLDALSGSGPIGWVRPELDELVGAQWLRAPARVVVSGNGIVTVPGIGRTASPAQAPPRHFRIRLSAQHYRPRYRAAADGIEFDAEPYDDRTPPQGHAIGATDAVLLPTASYPFASHLRVIRGVVRDPQGDPVEDALVEDVPGGVTPPRAAALSDADGTFALALLAAVAGTPMAVNATHARSGQTGSLQVTLPADLGRNLTITVHP
jgi:hypothetical protein